MLVPLSIIIGEWLRPQAHGVRLFCLKSRRVDRGRGTKGQYRGSQRSQPPTSLLPPTATRPLPTDPNTRHDIPDIAPLDTRSGALVLLVLNPSPCISMLPHSNFMSPGPPCWRPDNLVWMSCEVIVTLWPWRYCVLFQCSVSGTYIPSSKSIKWRTMWDQWLATQFLGSLPWSNGQKTLVWPPTFLKEKRHDLATYTIWGLISLHPSRVKSINAI